MGLRCAAPLPAQTRNLRLADWPTGGLCKPYGPPEAIPVICKLLCTLSRLPVGHFDANRAGVGASHSRLNRLCHSEALLSMVIPQFSKLGASPPPPPGHQGVQGCFWHRLPGSLDLESRSFGASSRQTSRHRPWPPLVIVRSSKQYTASSVGVGGPLPLAPYQESRWQQLDLFPRPAGGAASPGASQLGYRLTGPPLAWEAPARPSLGQPSRYWSLEPWGSHWATGPLLLLFLAASSPPPRPNTIACGCWECHCSERIQCQAAPSSPRCFMSKSRLFGSSPIRVDSRVHLIDSLQLWTVIVQVHFHSSPCR